MKYTFCPVKRIWFCTVVNIVLYPVRTWFQMKLAVVSWYLFRSKNSIRRPLRYKDRRQKMGTPDSFSKNVCLGAMEKFYEILFAFSGIESGVPFGLSSLIGKPFYRFCMCFSFHSIVCYSGFFPSLNAMHRMKGLPNILRCIFTGKYLLFSMYQKFEPIV